MKKLLLVLASICLFCTVVYAEDLKCSDCKNSCQVEVPSTYKDCYSLVCTYTCYTDNKGKEHWMMDRNTDSCSFIHLPCPRTCRDRNGEDYQEFDKTNYCPFYEEREKPEVIRR